MKTVQEEIDRCVETLDWVRSAHLVDIPGFPTILVHTLYKPDGEERSHYMRFDGPEGVRAAFYTLKDDLNDPSRPTAEEVDRILAEVATIPGVERIRISAMGGSERPTILFDMPRLGPVSLTMKPHLHVANAVERLLRKRRQDAFRQRITTMAVFGIASIARDRADAEMLVDTAILGTSSPFVYRGIAIHKPYNAYDVKVSIDLPGIEITDDGLVLKNLPVTVLIALREGRMRGRKVSQIVANPVMDLLEIKAMRAVEGGVLVMPSAWMGKTMGTWLDHGKALSLVRKLVPAC